MKVGLFYRPRTTPSTIFGAGIAADDFVHSLLRHGTCAPQLFCAPHDIKEAEARLGVRPRDERRLLDGRTARAIEVWHSPYGNAFEPLNLRRARPGGYHPITLAHHSLSYQGLLHQWFLRLLLQDVQPFDAIVCSTTAARDAIAKIFARVADLAGREIGARLAFRGRLEVIPLGVDTERFAPGDPAAARARLGLPRTALLLLWLGRFSAHDKADLLPTLRLFRDLVRANPKRALRLILAGTDTFTRESRVLHAYAGELGIADRITILRGVSADDKPFLYRAADVFLSPADNVQEMFGITPVEAMACGVPQVVADWNGYRDLVAHGETGFRVATHWADCDDEAAHLSLLPNALQRDHLALALSVAVDFAQYRAFVQTLIDRPALRREMAAASRARAVACFGWKTVIARLEALWRELRRMADARPARGGRDHYERPAFFATFAGHATHILGADARVRLTRAGRDLIRGRESLPTYHAAGGMLDGRLLERLLAELASVRAGRGASLGELSRRAAKPNRALRHLMWLLKYGFVERAP